jgi:hypothetical protein
MAPRGRRVARADVRAATRLVDADTGTNDHHRAREPEPEQRHNADANAIAAQHAVAAAHREPDAVRTSSVLRGR